LAFFARLNVPSLPKKTVQELSEKMNKIPIIARGNGPELLTSSVISTSAKKLVVITLFSL
jgi:hypothetical protein